MHHHLQRVVLQHIVIVHLALATLVAQVGVVQAADLEAAAAQLPMPVKSQNFDCATVSQIPHSECQALVALYNSTDGAGWRYGIGWLETATPCAWYGVACRADGRVSSLALGENDLRGSIPAELGSLTALQTLSLHSNHLSGTIPTQLGDLIALQELRLGYNHLNGVIPSQLGNLTQLQLLHLYNNQLSGLVPSELGYLTQLRSLDLVNNRLIGPVPPGLGNLAELDQLLLNHNHLSGSIPTQLAALKKLRHLGLASNQLSGTIPASLSDLVNLEYLDLGNNQLRGEIPPQLSSLAKLADASFGYNALSATDPALRSFLASKQPDWEETQTVTPSDLQATVDSDRIQLTWTPIRYIGDGGYYEISYATNAIGPYTVHGATTDKSAGSYTLPGLMPGAANYLRVRTYTPDHGAQQSALWSDYSEPVGSSSLAACFTLSRSRTGSGGDLVAHPEHSTPCPVGQYVAGQLIRLTATPIDGWRVASWTEADVYLGRAISTYLSMPRRNLTVTVHYQPQSGNAHRLFLPLLSQ